MKFVNIARIAAVVLSLAVVGAGLHLATHRHTGILRLLAYANHRLQSPSNSPHAQAVQQSGLSGPPHSVRLTWKPSTSVVAGYNIYRRDASGIARINAAPIVDPSFVDNTVQGGHTYYYVAKAVTKDGTESRPSNEIQAVIPSP